jgi:uncharacterized protein YeaO (DUF488 family)
MPVHTKRWNDPVEQADGFRLLVCRLRPRGVPKAGEPWHDWWPDLGPSRQLLDDFHGKRRPAPLPWDDYVPRYLDEMSRPAALWRLRALAQRIEAGETVTLLCSSACVDPARCHRTLLAELLAGVRAPEAAGPSQTTRRPATRRTPRSG